MNNTDKVTNITLKEYCDLAGYSYQSNWVQKNLHAGNLMVGMVKSDRFGNSWMITVLKSWHDIKKEGRGD